MWTPHLCFVLMGGSDFAEFLWQAPQLRQDCLVFRAHTGLEICSVDFEQLVVLMKVELATTTTTASALQLALVGERGVGQEGGEAASGLFSLEVGQQGVGVWLWKQRKYEIV